MKRKATSAPASISINVHKLNSWLRAAPIRAYFTEAHAHTHTIWQHRAARKIAPTRLDGR
ncbi:hypothetical protein C8R44DRAFT_772765 [Mycena epipterygia]|nr:hypothetical protein C8R44DRAFT_772765 [Mycena epipterygia]